MSINDLAEKVKPKVSQFYNLILIVIIAGIFFALGRISALEERKTPIKIIYPNSGQTGAIIDAVAKDGPAQNSQNSVSQSGGEVIGSKNGKKYYFPWCGTVKMIKPENQVKFASIEDARSAGYLPAANCKGLK